MISERVNEVELGGTNATIDRLFDDRKIEPFDCGYSPRASDNKFISEGTGKMQWERTMS